jgi:hydrogenase expression/formation protein HypC
MAKVTFNGVVKDICVEWLPEAVQGDYVMAHAGSALSIVNASEAEETLKISEQWASGLEKNDNQQNTS